MDIPAGKRDRRHLHAAKRALDRSRVGAAGNMRFVSEGTVLIENDALKYDNLEGNEFVLGFDLGTDGNYNVSFTVDGETYTAENGFTAEKLASISTLTDLAKVYVGVGSANGNSGMTTIGVTGIGKIMNARPYIEMIDNLSNIDLLAQGNVLRAARATYDALSSEMKAAITNYADLEAAEAEYARLAAEADADLIIMNHNLARRYRSVDKVPHTNWTATTTELPNGGLHMETVTNISYIGEGYVGAVNARHFKLQFDNYVPYGNNYGKGHLAITLANPAAGNEDCITPIGYTALVITIDPEKGRVFCLPSDQASGVASNADFAIGNKAYTLIQSDLLKGENIGNRRFSVETETVSGGLDVIIEISGQTLRGTIPDSLLSKTFGPGTFQRLQLMVGAGVPNNTYGTYGLIVDWIGIDPGNVCGDKEANFKMTSANTTVTGGATVDGGVAFLNTTNDAVTFTVPSASAIEARCQSYANGGAVEVYINDELITTLRSMKYTDLWRSLSENCDPSAPSVVTLKSIANEKVVIDGIYVTAPEVQGDLNGDGALNADDAICLKQAILGIFSGEVTEAFDVNKDGDVNVLDLVALKKNLRG